jgi:hypothetical protein
VDAERVAQLDGLLAEVESLQDDQARQTALTAVQTLLELYGEGFSRVMQRVPAEVAQALAEDELLGHLLLVHGLHPVDVEARVGKALPRGVELLRVQEGTAQVRVVGACLSEEFIERAILEAVPDLEAVQFETAAPASSFVALDSLVHR